MSDDQVNPDVFDPSTVSGAIDISDLDLAGKVIVGEQVTSGGFSNISIGVLLKDGFQIKVAVKSLRVRGNAVPETKERLCKRFYREVLLWRTLQHPNIVPLLGYTMLPNDFPTLISLWYTNGSVIEYLASNSNIDRRALTLDVVNGLEYLHSIPVAHGDLKGENVLVDDDGRAVLCDFGMSQFIDEASHIIGFTTTNAYIGGTDRFLCPELLEDAPKCIATDIWALGCLVVLILTDIIPYSNIIKRTAVLSSILRGHPPMANRKGEIEKPLWECIKKCWSTSQEDRPQASELQHLLAAPLTASPRSLDYSARWTTPQQNISRAKFSPDGRYLAVAVCTGSSENIVGIWKVGRDALTPLNTWRSVDDYNGVIRKVAWSASQRHLLLMGDTAARVFVVETGEFLFSRNNCTWASFSPSSDTVAFLEIAGDISIKDLTQPDSTESTIKSSLLPKEIIMMAFSPDQRHMTVLTLATLEVYNVRTNKVEATALLPKEDLMWHRTISLSKDGRTVLLSSRNQNPEIWWMETSEPDMIVTQLSLQYRYTPVCSGVECAMFGGMKEDIILGTTFNEDEDICICIWDRNTTELIHTVPLIGRNLCDISFLPNSLDTHDIVLASSPRSLDDDDITLEIWSIPDSEPQ